MPQVVNYTSNSIQALHGPVSAREISIKLAVVGGVATQYPAGQIVQETATPGTYGVVVAGGTAPCLVLKNDVEVDAAGLHFLGGAGASNVAELGGGTQSVPAFKTGEFDTRDLRGVAGAALVVGAQDSAILARLGAMRQGTPAAGIVRMI